MSVAFKVASFSACAELGAKIEARTARVGIIGLGYIGLSLALLYSRQEFPVTGFDIDLTKINMLAAGKSYLVRIEADEIQQANARGWTVTTDFSRLSEMGAVIICVTTTLDEHRSPDLSYITKTAHVLALHIHEGQLVVLESTTYPGTTEEILVPILEKENPHGLLAARDGDQPANRFYSLES